MDNETVKQDLYEAIGEFLALDATADNETITTRYTTIKVFADELPVYPNPQTQAQTDAYNMAHSESEADLIYFSPDEANSSELVEDRHAALSRLQDKATKIERILRDDSL